MNADAVAKLLGDKCLTLLHTPRDDTECLVHEALDAPR